MAYEIILIKLGIVVHPLLAPQITRGQLVTMVTAHLWRIPPNPKPPNVVKVSRFVALQKRCQV